jgi:hypothetical protein
LPDPRQQGHALQRCDLRTPQLQPAEIDKAADGPRYGYFRLVPLTRLGTTCRGRKRDVVSKSVVREIRTPRSMRGMWKRSYDPAVKAPPDERGLASDMPDLTPLRHIPILPSADVRPALGQWL